MFLNVFLLLLTVVAIAVAFWQFAARNRPLFGIFSLEGPAVIDQTVYSRMKVIMRNWGGVSAQNTTVTLDVIATSHTKPRKTLNWSRTISGPVYPGQEFSLQPDLDFRELLASGYRFRLIASITCSSQLPLGLRQLKIVRLLTHSQKQVWEWNENMWKLMGSELNNLQAAAE